MLPKIFLCEVNLGLDLFVAARITELNEREEIIVDKIRISNL